MNTRTDTDYKSRLPGFYVGSCRYQRLFPSHFPPRLHSTSEIRYFFQHIDKLAVDLHSSKSNLIYGDCRHPMIMPKTLRLVAHINDTLAKAKRIILEISSRKVVFSNGMPLNAYYYKREHSSEAGVTKLTWDQMHDDLFQIQNIVRDHFHITTIIAIPHIDLALPDGTNIQERKDLKLWLLQICDRLNIGFIDPSLAVPNGSLSDVFKDSTHFSDSGRSIIYDYIRMYL